MPKMKSNRSAMKRVKSTGKGRYKIRHANRNHILTKNTTKVKRHRRQNSLVTMVNQKMLKVVLKLFKKARRV
jgi:large subunit ribosomal protein L35